MPLSIPMPPMGWAWEWVLGPKAACEEQQGAGKGKKGAGGKDKTEPGPNSPLQGSQR